MVRIEIDGDCTSVEIQGEGSKASIDVCLAMHAVIEALREMGKSDGFIRAAFHICMNDKDS